MAITPLGANDSLADLPASADANLEAIRTLHWGPSSPSNPVDGMLWSDSASGVTQQRVSGAWVTKWIIGRPVLALPKVADIVTLGVKYLTTFQPRIVFVQVRVKGRESVDDSTTLLFQSDAPAVVTKTVVTNDGGFTAATVSVEFHADGVTVTRTSNADPTQFLALGGVIETGDGGGAADLPAKPMIEATRQVLDMYPLLNQAGDAVRGHHAGASAPADPALGMLWASTLDGVLYQCTKLAPETVWSAVIPIGVDAEFTVTSTKRRHPVAQGDADADGFSNSLAAGQFTIGDGFAPVACLATVEFRSNAEWDQNTPHAGPTQTTRTLLFVDPALNGPITDEPIAVSDEDPYVGPNELVSIDIRCRFRSTGVQIDKIDPFSGGTGFASVKLKDVTLLG